MKKVYIETYGCQMNVADSEVVAAVLATAGYDITETPDDADAVLLNTCSVRDNAEQKILARLGQLRAIARRRDDKPLILGVIGCMAARVKEELLKQGVMLVAGPDSYMDLPSLMGAAEAGEPAVNVESDSQQTYRDIIPRRLGGPSVSGFVSIMRGCNNFCTYCIVPYTRGRERSRSPQSILAEMAAMQERGVADVTLLGQNVNSYRFEDEATGDVTDFPALLRLVASSFPSLRIRFTTSHPKDIVADTVRAMAEHPNLARHIHFCAQAGSNSVLKRMNRRYTREEYLDKVAMIRRELPDCSITTDLFTGFCGETEDDFEQTLSLMREVGFDSAFMFKYSERPGTVAARTMADDVAEADKIARLNRMIELQGELSLAANEREIGLTREVIVEGVAKRSTKQLVGRTSQNKTVVFDRPEGVKPGDRVDVEITGATRATLLGRPAPRRD